MAAGLLLLGSLVLLRIQVILDLGLGPTAVVAHALPSGVLYDLVAVLLVSAAGLAVSAFSPAISVVVWVLAAWSVWTVGLANLLYFRFFGGMLELWVVRFHSTDVEPVATSALALAIRPAILASAVCVVIAAVVFVRGSQRAPAANSRLRRIGVATALVVLALLVRELPGWTGLYGQASAHPMLREQVLQVWLRDAFSRSPAATEQWTWQDQIWRARSGTRDPSEEQIAWAREQLERFRQLGDPLPSGAPRDPGGAGTGAHRLGPGASPFAERPSTGEVAPIRRRLALPEQGRINVVVLFVESMRALEFLDEDLRERVFPRTREIVAKRGISFTQAYASAVQAGQSVRARFTTLCSMLPNLEGAATYLAYPWIDVPCLAEILNEAGYRTIWFTSAAASYHNASIFERAHGTEVFYDEVHFRKQGIVERVGDWGLADLPVLEEVVRVLEREGRSRHFFAALTTISSHFPMSMVPEGPLPESLAAETAGFPEYQGYLSRMIYEDRAVANFLELLAASELADDTLVVLVGDHSIPIPPHLELTPVQQIELLFRVPLALISARQSNPLEIRHPVHQLDVAPTVALVAGVAAPEEWLGRGLFMEPAAPWVALHGGRLHYRTESRACYGLLGTAPSCYLSAGADPLLDRNLAEAPEDAELTRYFSGLGRAMQWLISQDRLASR
ncbi:MAG TPA: LTA synthase family protein [Thermoanaerobaculia bacterium]|nr:LTA synthase family protein [Thermoanaerobaculia bacterium]